MAALRHAHCDALLGDRRTSNAYEHQDDRVALRRCFGEEGDLVAYWIRENRFEHEALALLDELDAKAIGELGRRNRIELELTSEVICIQETQPAWREVSCKESRLARAIRAREGDDDWPRIER